MIGDGVGLPQLVVLVVAGQRIFEVILSARNVRRLKARGAVEHGAGHYPAFVALHAAWLGALFVLTPPAAVPSLPWIGLFLALQGARLWVIASLGRYWTTRVLTVPDAPLVRTGPYRWLRHPNYLIVAAELIVLPMAFGQWAVAAVATLLNLPLTAWRIRVEDRALRPRR